MSTSTGTETPRASTPTPSVVHVRSSKRKASGNCLELHSACVVQSGALLFRGHHRMMVLFGRGDLADVPFLQEVSGGGTYDALASVRLQFLSEEALQTTHRQAREEAKLQLLRYLFQVQPKMVLAGTTVVEQRLAYCVLYLMERFGISEGGGSTMLPWKLRRSLLSELVDVQEETTIRIISRWRQDGWISFETEGAHLLPEGLKPLQKLAEKA